MRKKTRSKDNLTEKDKEIIYNLAIPVDVASFMTGIDSMTVSQARFRARYKKNLREAAARFRQKQKEEQEQLFGKPHSTYNFWSADEIKYILTSKDSDREQSEKLGRTIYSIQKKRERELKKKRRRP